MDENSRSYSSLKFDRTNSTHINVCHDVSSWVLDLGWDSLITFSFDMCSQRSASYILKLMKIEEVIQRWNKSMVHRSNVPIRIGAKDDQSYRKVESFEIMYLHEFWTWVEITW